LLAEHTQETFLFSLQDSNRNGTDRESESHHVSKRRKLRRCCGIKASS
jgi:hypothetical protein